MQHYTYDDKLLKEYANCNKFISTYQTNINTVSFCNKTNNMVTDQNVKNLDDAKEISCNTLLMKIKES